MDIFIPTWTYSKSNCDWICEKGSSTHIHFDEFEKWQLSEQVQHKPETFTIMLRYLSTLCYKNLKSIAITCLKLWAVEVGKVDVWKTPFCKSGHNLQ